MVQVGLMVAICMMTGCFMGTLWAHYEHNERNLNACVWNEKVSGVYRAQKNTLNMQLSNTVSSRVFTVAYSTMMPLRFVKQMHSDMPEYARYATGKHNILNLGDSTLCGGEFGVLETQYTRAITDICLNAKISGSGSMDIFCSDICNNVALWRAEVDYQCEKLVLNKCKKLGITTTFYANFYSQLFLIAIVFKCFVFYKTVWYCCCVTVILYVHTMRVFIRVFRQVINEVTIPVLVITVELLQHVAAAA
jgi:hypothetical protein